MRSLIVIVVMLVLCWLFTDVRSEHAVFNVLAPLGVAISVLALTIWGVFAMVSGRKKYDQRPPPPEFFKSHDNPSDDNI
ncbi:hypothetical protein [Gilvimarinus polysaccharolyticus]|uniref:hypothetical protein n=1 Tax=Gilvimarinus polysaccharolyticus TaxID=863921 RepID=UPI000673ADB4|nr:hypothetical protein [Gilvimarinus polysaccharolyticus]